jgi:hypothetical protein
MAPFFGDAKVTIFLKSQRIFNPNQLPPGIIQHGFICCVAQLFY